MTSHMQVGLSGTSRAWAPTEGFETSRSKTVAALLLMLFATCVVLVFVPAGRSACEVDGPPTPREKRR